MVIQDWTGVLQNSFMNIWKGFNNFVPNFIVAVVIFFIGWFVAALLGKVVGQIVRSLKVDNALKSLKVDEFLKRADFELDSGAFLGGLVKWFVIIVFLVASFDVLGLSQINQFLQTVVLNVLPQVIIASVIILVAAVIAEAMNKLVSGAASAGGIKSANFAGSIARWAIWIFGILTALSQLGIGAQIIQTLFTGFVVAIAIALGLSFGLGGQEAAARFIEKVRHDISDKNHNA